jgi:NitT/TauT family transport system substrate-binding protein
MQRAAVEKTTMSIIFMGIRRLGLLAAMLALAVLATSCGDDGGGPAVGSSPAAGGDEAGQVRLGVFPNVTHAPGLVGIEGDHFQKALGEDVDLRVSYFNAGGEAIEALFSGALDLTYIGPNPAINGFAQSGGDDVRLIAGATSGGAFLVVRDGIDAAEDLAGATLATPALGNTQDVALRAWLADEGYETDVTGGGEVSVRPLANPDILQAFQNGDLDGAWVPEPWATRLIDEADGHVLVDERDLWPDGRFVTTHVLVRTGFLERNPGLVRRFIEGHLAAVDAIADDPAAAQVTVLDAIEAISGSRLSDEIVAQAWANLTFTWDPIASSLAESAADATEVGLLDPVDLDGIYDLTILNELLSQRGDPEVQGL